MASDANKNTKTEPKKTAEEAGELANLTIKTTAREYSSFDHDEENDEDRFELETEDNEVLGDGVGTAKSLKFFCLNKLLWCANVFLFLAWAIITSISTYFIQDSERRGISKIATGFIFAVQPLGTGVASFFMVKINQALGGVKRAVILGCFLSAVNTMLFGFVPAMLGVPPGSSNDAMVALYLTFRFFTGVSLAMSETGIFIFLSRSFTEEGDIGKALGMAEMSIGIGSFLGPLVGSALYIAGEAWFEAGSSLALAFPTLVLGIILILLGVIFRYPNVLPDNTAEEDEEMAEGNSTNTPSSNNADGDYTFSPMMIWILVTTSGSASAWTGMDVTLANQLEIVYGYTDAMIGAVFSIPGGLYLCLAFPIGVVIDRFIARDREIVDNPSLCGSSNAKTKMLHLVMSGFFLYTLGFVCVGLPFPSDELREQLQWLLYCGLVLIGTGSTLTLVVVLPLLQQYLGANAPEELNDRLTSYWNGSYNLGAFLGPIIWSAINESKGFSFTYLAIAVTTAVFGISYMIIGARERRATRMRESNETRES